jgi:DNA polymerase-3 subunit delta'
VANPVLFGHAAEEAVLAEAALSGKLHHAWLITGPAGVGKATLAFRFARWLLAGLPVSRGLPPLAVPEGHPVFRRMAASAHADLRVLRRTVNGKTGKLRDEIGVDEVRAAGGFLKLTPAEGGWRVLIIDRADELNTSAANALLKLLEEPPPRAVILLVCNAAGRLPATVRSRCRRLPVGPLAPEAMAQALARFLPEVTQAERARLAALADGSPGRALLLAEGEGLRIAGLVDEALAALPQLDPRRAYAIADALGRGENAFATFMTLLRGAIATAVRASARGEADGEQTRIATLRESAAWSAVWGQLGAIERETTGLHLDARQAVANALGLLAVQQKD